MRRYFELAHDSCKTRGQSKHEGRENPHRKTRQKSLMEDKRTLKAKIKVRKRRGEREREREREREHETKRDKTVPPTCNTGATEVL